jgi:hypothetical protein
MAHERRDSASPPKRLPPPDVGRRHGGTMGSIDSADRHPVEAPWRPIRA